jgi:hypothetical protein
MKKLRHKPFPSMTLPLENTLHEWLKSLFAFNARSSMDDAPPN